MFEKLKAYAIGILLCVPISPAIGHAELNLNKSIDWLSAQPGATGVDRAEVAAIQSELKRLGCRRGPNNGEWRKDAVEQFSRFLAYTREPYSPNLTVEDVLKLLRVYADSSSSDCTPKRKSNTASNACTLDSVRQDWILKRDNLLRGRLKTEKERSAYVGLDTLLRSLNATGGNYASLIPEDDDEMQWLRPSRVPLSVIRDLMRGGISDLENKIKKGVNYWAVASNATCRQCLYLDAYGLLDNKNRASGDALLSETKPGGNSITTFGMESITFRMLHSQYRHIREWHILYSAGTKGDEDTKNKAKFKLIAIIENFRSLQQSLSRKPVQQEFAASYYVGYEAKCVSNKRYISDQLD